MELSEDPLARATTQATNMLMQERATEDGQRIKLHERSIQGLRAELDSAQRSLTDSRHAVQQLEESAAGAAEQIADLQKQVRPAVAHCRPHLC
jgi:predicted  nucleic acid-binding Zn-ribbon protein